MNAVFRKLQASVLQQAFVLNQAQTLCRATPSIQHPVCDSVNRRQYKTMPTHGIGRWRHLVPKVAVKKKKEKGKHQMVDILEATETAYGTLNVTVSGYDMTLVEHYAKHIHNQCNQLGVKVAECYALPTKTSEVLLMEENATKMHVEFILKTHARVVQLSRLDTSVCPILMEVILKNQPEGIQLSMNEHTMDDYQARFKTRPDLEGVKAQLKF